MLYWQHQLEDQLLRLAMRHESISNADERIGSRGSQAWDIYHFLPTLS